MLTYVKHLWPARVVKAKTLWVSEKVEFVNAPLSYALASPEAAALNSNHFDDAFSRADSAELPVGQRLREDAGIYQCESIPFRCPRVLSLEIPEHPSLRVSLKGLQLCLNIASRIVLEGLGPASNVVDTLAGLDEGGTRECPIVPSTCAIAVEPGRTVSHCGTPLADEGPLVGTVVYEGVVTDVLAVLPRLHSDQLRSEDLVLMVVNCHVLGVGVGGNEEAVVVTRLLKSVLHDHYSGLTANTLVSVA